MTDKTDQMYFDHGPESFLSEVGQILKVMAVHINILESADPHMKVRIRFSGVVPGGSFSAQTGQHTDTYIEMTKYGRSYGEALRKVREQIREDTGK